MAITRGNSVFASSTTADNVTVTVPAGVADGDVLLFAYSKTSSTGYTPTSWSFDFGTWVETPLSTDLGSTQSGMAVLTVADASALPASITGGFDGGSLWTASASLTVYSGVDTANPVESSDNSYAGQVTGGTLPSLSVASDGSKYVGSVVQRRENTLTFDTLTRFVHELGANATSTENTRHAVADGDVNTGTAAPGGWSSSDANTRGSGESAVVLNPAATETQLATPTGWTFVKTADTAEVVGSWTAVTDAATYDYEVEEWDGALWQPFALSSVTAPTTTFTLDDTDGVQFSTLYRARVRAVPAV